MEKKVSKKENERLRAVTSTDARDYAKYWVVSREMEYVKGGMWTSGERIMRYDQIRKKLLVDYTTDLAEVRAELAKMNAKVAKEKERKAYLIKTEVLNAALDMVVIEKAEKKLIETRAKFAYDPSVDPTSSLATQFVSNLTTVDVELATAVIQHYIWMAKRRLFGKPVENHIVPVIVGGQGKGKSQNVDRLLAPLAEYKLDLHDAGALLDERRYHAYAENFVTNLDEMSRLDKVDFNKLKSFITTPTLNSRTLGTHDVTGCPNNITIIGTSNTAMKRQVFDTTGMRRFYQITVDKEISRDVSESIDYLKLWKSVDENSPSPIIKHQLKLAEHQENLRAKEYVEMFFEEYHINPSKPQEYKVEVREGMYKAFRDWAKITGNEGPWMKEQFMKEMIEESGIRRVVVTGKNYFTVNIDCFLNPDYAHGLYPVLLSESDIAEVNSIVELDRMLKNEAKKENFERAALIKRRINTIIEKTSGGNFLDL